MVLLSSFLVHVLKMRKKKRKFKTSFYTVLMLLMLILLGLTLKYFRFSSVNTNGFLILYFLHYIINNYNSTYTIHAPMQHATKGPLTTTIFLSDEFFVFYKFKC